eukprot:14575090-Alexandrium_andersonii.AAC.1
MVVMVQDCTSAIYVGDALLTAEDGKTRLTEAHARASWPALVGEVRPQAMGWDAPLQPGFKSKLQQLPFMTLTRHLNC